MAVARKIALNVFFNSGAKVISTVFSLIGIGIITRYLGKEGFGEYSIAVAFFSLLGSLADLGLYTFATREISRKDADENSILSNVMTLRITTSLSIFLLAIPIVSVLNYSSEVKQGIIIASLAFVFSSSYMVLNGIFQKHLAMYKVTTAEMIGKGLQVSLMLLVSWKDWGFMAIMLAFLGGLAFNSTTVFILSRHYLKYKLSFDFSYWKKIIQESAPMGIAAIITFLYFRMDTFLLSYFTNSATVGIYNAAYKIIENLIFFPSMVIGLIFPLMSRYIFTEREKFEDISNKTFKIFCLLLTPIIIGTLFLANHIIWFIGGSEFTQSISVLRILILALGFIFFGSFFNSVLLAGNLQKKMMLALSVCATFNIAANIFIIPRYSYNGAAIISVVTEFLVVIIAAYISITKLHYRPRFDHLSGLVTSGVSMAIFLFFFSDKNFFAVGFFSIMIYAAGLWLTKSITREELALVFSRNTNGPIEEPR